MERLTSSADLLGSLNRAERIALGVLLQGSLDRMTHVATCVLADYHERHSLGCYGEMIAETAELAAELSQR